MADEEVLTRGWASPKSTKTTNTKSYSSLLRNVFRSFESIATTIYECPRNDCHSRKERHITMKIYIFSKYLKEYGLDINDENICCRECNYAFGGDDVFYSCPGLKCEYDLCDKCYKAVVTK